MIRLIRMDEISIITSLHYARENKYRMQKEKRLTTVKMLFKNKNIIIFAGPYKGTPKVFPVRKDIHEI